MNSEIYNPAAIWRPTKQALSAGDAWGAIVALKLGHIANLNFPTTEESYAARQEFRSHMTAPEISALLDYNDRRVAASIKVIGEVGHRDALDFLHLVIRSNGTGGDFDAKETVSAAIGAVRAIYAMEIKDARNLLETETALRALINAPAVTPENKALATELLGIIGTTEKRTQGAAAAKEVVGEHTEKAAGKGGRKLGFGIGGY